MKIDKDKLAALAAMKDDELWAQIKLIASAYGIKLPDKTPPRSELDKVRGAFNGSKLNLGEALGVINEYRKGENNGRRS